MSTAKKVTCPYCGIKSEPTREHVLAKWVRRELKGYHAWTPKRPRHEWGGDPVIADVCHDCNHGPLSRLDKIARSWWEATLSGVRSISSSGAVALAKWAAKVAFNSQRAVVAEGSLGREPRLPKGIGRWVNGSNSSREGVSVCAALIPVEARSSDLPAGIYSFGEMGWPCRYVCLPAAVLYVAWDEPPVTGRPRFDAEHSARWLSVNAPAVRLDGLANASIDLPDLKDPSVLHRGLYRRMGK